MITYANWQKNKVDFEVDQPYKGALKVLTWAFREYEDDIVYACSFGIEGMVLIDLITKIKEDAKIIFLDTNVHFQETYDTIDQIRVNYPKLQINMKQPKLTLAQQAQQFGDELWARDANACCAIRKVAPLHEVLNDTVAWISGLRRQQSPSRSMTDFINADQTFQSIKICPLIHWTSQDIWRYVTDHNLPYNPLHDRGYPSIGCEKCTIPTTDQNDNRAGRWQGSMKTECGLHQ